MLIPALTVDELDSLSDDFAALVTAEIGRTLRVVARRLPPVPTLDDLTSIRHVWTDRCPGLLDRVEAGYWAGVDKVHSAVLVAVQGTGLAADAAPVEEPPVDPPPFEIPRVSNPMAQVFMANASNRLVQVSDGIWEVARTQLVQGMLAGEGVSKLRDRISGSTPLASPRAEVIARTEINGAANAGSYQQMRAYGLPATKQWLATSDERTRPDHADADGQERDLDKPFDVGGEAMDHPHAEGASAANVVNCRCTVTFEITDDDVERLAAPVDLPQYRSARDIQMQAQEAAETWYRRGQHGHAQAAWLDYQYAGGYERINGALRAATPDAETKKIQRDIAAAFAKGGVTTTEPVTLHRGLLGAKKDWSTMQVGRVYIERGVMSTTASPSAASGWLVDSADFNTVPSGSAVLDLRVPPGTRILGGMSSSFETMLPPGTRYRIISIEPDEKLNSVGEPQGVYSRITAEVLP